MDDEDDILYGKPDIDNLKSLLGRENQLLTAILENKHIITDFQFEGFKMEDKKNIPGYQDDYYTVKIIKKKQYLVIIF